jgi:hypothetical protein
MIVCFDQTVPFVDWLKPNITDIVDRLIFPLPISPTAIYGSDDGVFCYRMRSAGLVYYARNHSGRREP